MEAQEEQRIRDIARQIKAEQGFVPFGETGEAQARLRLPGERPEAAPSPEPGIEGEEERVRRIAQQLRRTQISAAEIGGLTRRENLENLLHSEAIDFIGDLSAESQQVVAEFGTGIANLALRGGHSLGMLSGIPELETPKLAEHVKSPAAKVIGSLLGTLFIPVPGIGAKTVLGRIAAGTAQAGALGGIFGAARGEPGRGALMGAALGAPLAGAAESLHLPFMLTRAAMGKARSIPEIQSIMRRLGNVHASIGDISNSIGLKRLYNLVLGHIPFSGVPRQAENLIQETNRRAGEIHSHLTGDILNNRDLRNLMMRVRQGEISLNDLPPQVVSLIAHGKLPEEELSDQIIQGLRNNYFKQETTKRNLYHATNREAEADNFVLEDPEILKDTARKLLKEEARVTEQKMNPEQLEALKRAATGLQEPGLNESAMSLPNGEVLQIEGKPAEKVRTFNEAIATHSGYNKLIREAEDADKMRIAQVFREVREALEESIGAQAKKIRNPLLIRRWQKARDFFREHIVPNRKAPIRNVLFKQAKGFENIHNVLYKKEFEKVLAQLDPHTRRLFASKGLGRVTKLNQQTGNYEAEPEALMNAYQNLTGRLDKDSGLRNRLFSPEEQEEFKDLDAFVKASAEPRLQAQTRPTGMRTIAELLSAAALPAGIALASGGRGTIARNLLGVTGGARAVAALLASPRFRQQILRGRAFEETPFLLQQTLQRLAALFARQQTGGQRR